MAESATAAPGTESPEALKLLERIEAFAEAWPAAREYWVDNELDASYLLLAAAAAMQQVLPGMVGDDQKTKARAIANSYRAAVAKGQALERIASMTDQDRLWFYGLEIVTRPTLAH